MVDFTNQSGARWSNDSDGTVTIAVSQAATGGRIAQVFRFTPGLYLSQFNVRMGIEGPTTGSAPTRVPGDGVNAVVFRGTPNSETVAEGTHGVSVEDIPRYTPPSPGDLLEDVWDWVPFVLTHPLLIEDAPYFIQFTRTQQSSTDVVHLHNVWDPDFPYPDGSQWNWNSSIGWQNSSSGNLDLAFQIVSGPVDNVALHLTISFEGLVLKGYCAAYNCPDLSGPHEATLTCFGPVEGPNT